MTQTILPFDAPANRISRSTDPATSSEAAEDITDNGVRSRMMALALSLVSAKPGRTAAELEAESGLGDGKIRKRLNDLRHAGRAHVGEPRRCEVTGKRAQTWYAGPA